MKEVKADLVQRVKTKDLMSILKRADEIINHRAEEKEREYGPLNESIAKAARMASEMCNKEITTEDFFKCMVALKLSRLAYSNKEDTLLDAAAYIGGLDNYYKEIGQ